MNMREIIGRTWFSCALMCSKYQNCGNILSKKLANFKILKEKSGQIFIFPLCSRSEGTPRWPEDWIEIVREVSATAELLTAIKLNFDPHNKGASHNKVTKQNHAIAELVLELTK